MVRGMALPIVDANKKKTPSSSSTSTKDSDYKVPVSETDAEIEPAQTVLTEPISVQPNHMDATCFGYCVSCETVHELRIGASLEYAQTLLERIVQEGCLDFEATPSKRKKKFTLEKLFPGDRSHMLGVLECLDDKGDTIWLKAYSSLPGGYRKVPGWVPMIISKEDFEKEVKPVQNQIKAISKRIEQFGDGSIRAQQLARKRKRYSQDLQAIMPSLYRLHNFRRQRRKLTEAFYGSQGIPGGIGECCAPKLLNHAARKHLKPISLAEFFWGKKDNNGEREKALFRICCKERCQPIMGFMLCGLETEKKK